MDNLDAIALSKSQLILCVQQFLKEKSNREQPTSFLIATWERFYRDYSPHVRRIVSRYLPAKADQDDCFQHIWQKLLQVLPRLSFDPARGTFHNWLATVAHRLTQRFLTKIRRQRVEITISDSGWENNVSLQVAGPLDRLQTQEKIRLVHQVLQQLRSRLSDRTYQVFYLRWMKMESFGEIAQRLNLTTEQVRWRNHRAKRKAEELLTCSLRSDPS